MGAAIRRDNLRNFRDGLIDILVACRALDEGVDIPDAQCAVIASASASRRQRIQRLGRVLRTSKHKRLATVYTIYATDLEKQRLITEQGQLGDVAEVRWMRANVRSDA
jgi:superfamily II DNA or RNA helicase